MPLYSTFLQAILSHGGHGGLWNIAQPIITRQISSCLTISCPKSTKNLTQKQISRKTLWNDTIIWLKVLSHTISKSPLKYVWMMQNKFEDIKKNSHRGCRALRNIAHPINAEKISSCFIISWSKRVVNFYVKANTSNHYKYLVERGFLP